MEIRVRKSPDRKFIKYVKRAAKLFADKLITNKRILKNCYLTIEFDPNLEEYGYCGVEGLNTKNEPRHFVIEINSSIGAKLIFETLAHEMIHVKQLVMKETDYQFKKWKGEPIGETDYWDLPWELEAFSREQQLVTYLSQEEKLWEVFEGFNDPDKPIKPVPLGWKSGNNEEKVVAKE